MIQGSYDRRVKEGVACAGLQCGESARIGEHVKEKNTRNRGEITWMHGPTVVRVLVFWPERELVLELELGQVLGLGAGDRCCAIYVQLNKN